MSERECGSRAHRAPVCEQRPLFRTTAKGKKYTLDLTLIQVLYIHFMINIEYEKNEEWCRRVAANGETCRAHENRVAA